jgi:hypothetical protein
MHIAEPSAVLVGRRVVVCLLLQVLMGQLPYGATSQANLNALQLLKVMRMK